MALNDIHNLLYGDGARPFRGRVRTTVLVAAGAILVEDVGTANHANRLAWAQGALGTVTGLDAAAEKMLLGVAANSTIQANGDASSDGDIQWTVNSLIDTVYAAGS